MLDAEPSLDRLITRSVMATTSFWFDRALVAGDAKWGAGPENGHSELLDDVTIRFNRNRGG